MDELIISFTHTTELPWMLPRVPPTGRRVEVPVVVVAHFRNNKLAHEHIFWDQGAVLKQTGLITDPDVPSLGQRQHRGLGTSRRAGRLKANLGGNIADLTWSS